MKKQSIFMLWVFIFLIIFPCTVFGASLTLSWTANTETDVEGYKVYYGTATRNYGPSISVGNVTSYNITGLDAGITYYFAVTAIDTSGNESGYSAEVTVTMPEDTGGGRPAVSVLWKCDSATLTTYQAGDGQTVETGNASFVAGKDGNGVRIYSGNRVYFNVTDGNNINYDEGTISFWVRVTGSKAFMTRLFQVGSDYHDFALYRYTDDTTLRFYYGHTASLFRLNTNVFDGQWHYMTLIWDRTNATTSLKVDDDTEVVSVLGTEKPAPTDSRLYIASNNGENYLAGIIDEFSISYGTAVETDTESPQIAMTSPSSGNSFTTETSPVAISGTASDNTALKQITWSDESGASGTATGLANWSIADIALGEGNNAITVVAEDTSGNKKSLIVTATYSPQDTTSPAISIVSPVSSGVYTTETSPVTISGTASDNKSVSQILWNNVQGGGGTASGTTSWVASNIALAEGENTLTVTAYDEAGNESSQSITIIYEVPDTIAPGITILTPTTEGLFETEYQSISLSGGASDNIDVSQVTWSNSAGGSGVAAGTTVWQVAGIPLTGGVNTITVTAFDSAGNIGVATLSITYTPVDETAPVISITSPTTLNVYETSSGTVSLRGSSSDNEGVIQVSWNNFQGGSGNAVGTDSWAVSGIGLTEGINEISVTATDARGNVGSSLLTVTYKTTSMIPGITAGWSADSARLNAFQPGDSDVVNLSGASFVSGRDGNGVEVKARNSVYFTATDGNNIYLDKGEIGLWVKSTEGLGFMARLFQLGTDYHDFALYRFTSNTALRLYYGDTATLFNVATDIFDGNWHEVILKWDRENAAVTLTIDGVENAGTLGTNKPVPTNNNFYVGNNNGYNQFGGIIDELYIKGETPQSGSNVVWEADSGTLNSWDSNDSGTVELINSPFVQGKTGNGVEVVNGSSVYFNAGDGKNINLDKGEIGLSVRLTRTKGFMARLFQIGTDYHDFALYRYTGDQALRFYYGRSATLFNVNRNIFDGQWHSLVLKWDRGAGVTSLSIDGVVVEGVLGANKPVPSNERFYIGSNAGFNYFGGVFDEFYLNK